ncbi:MAG: hypothetical protein MUP03_03680 [Anaerolineales bacterium]|nr:hypothetical protein [Anaerolineales bacterium]
MGRKKTRTPWQMIEDTYAKDALDYLSKERRRRKNPPKTGGRLDQYGMPY